MEIEITNDTNNAVAKRREIEFYVIQTDRTPQRDEVKREVCKKLNLSPDSTLVVSLNQTFGVKRSRGIIHSYQNADVMKSNENAYLFERHERRVKKLAKAAAEKGEKPAEEKEEEKAEETK
jgi:ribosomal protein S24E